MAARIKRDDTVVVVSGKDRGKTGKVLRVDPRHDRVVVEGVNIVKRHQRPTTLRDTQRRTQVEGGVIEAEAPIHISNVMPADPKDGKPTRVGTREQEGRRFRVARRSGDQID